MSLAYDVYISNIFTPLHLLAYKLLPNTTNTNNQPVKLKFRYTTKPTGLSWKFTISNINWLEIYLLKLEKWQMDSQPSYIPTTSLRLPPSPP